MQQAGIGDKFHSRSFGGIDHVAVLYGSLADFTAGDQQQFIDPGQCLSEGSLGRRNQPDAQGCLVG